MPDVSSGLPGEPAHLRGQRITVMGLGRFGGGVGAVNFLLKHGALVTLTDLLPAAELQMSLDQIDVTSLHKLTLGEHRDEDFTQCDLLVVNPAVKPGNRYVGLAVDAGIPVTSELSLFWKFQRGRLAAITGTVGKSTTAALLVHVLQHAGYTARLGGNIGLSLLGQLDQITSGDWTVLEVSSFQLHNLAPLHPRPDVALVTNFFPNHLDWHGNLDHYCSSKQQLLRWQTPDQWAVYEAESNVAKWPTAARRLEVREDEPASVPEFPQLPGPHNRRNIAMVHAVATHCFGIAPEVLVEACRTFTSLPHRLEFVGEVESRLFYNDSKATTPEAAIAALKSFTQPIRLIAGGADKGVDLSAFAAAIAMQAASVSLMGATAEPIAAMLQEFAGGCCVQTCSNLSAAVNGQWDQSRPGDILLLSPGCASFGEFRNYEERGDLYRALVDDLRCRATS